MNAISRVPMKGRPSRLNEIRERAKAHFPSVLLTFLSIIQAVALELWWSSMTENGSLWEGGWAAWLGWAQYTVILLGILEIWLVYTSLVMRFVWVPAFQDSVFPFVIGIIEFSMVALLGPQHLGNWIAVLGLMFLVMIGSNHLTFKKARGEPENERHFKNVEPAKAKDFVSQLVVVGGIFAMAAVVGLTGNREALALGCVVSCGLILLLQIEVSRRFWADSMA